jgi:hypothetical protein
MYSDPRKLERGDPSLRLAAPADYPIEPEPCTVAVAPVEVPRLVDRFPVAWRLGQRVPDLVAVIGLRPDQSYWRRVRDGASTIRPLLIEAYPLTTMDDGATEKLPVLVDSLAPRPGAETTAAFREDGTPTPELDRRCQALWTFIRSRRALAGFFCDLEQRQAFVPWALDFRNETDSVSIEGLHVLRPDFDGSQDQRDLIAAHGWAAAQLMSLHRISLHRIKSLLRDLNARAA